MQRLFSTSDVLKREAFGYWHEVACKYVVDHECCPTSRSDFEADIMGDALADIDVVQLDNSAMFVSHDAGHIARAQGDKLILCKQLNGSLRLEQDSNEALLRSGEMALLDPLLAYTAAFSPGSSLMVIKLPRKALKARIGNFRPMICEPMRLNNSDISFVSSAMSLVPEYVGRLGQIAQSTVRETLLDLVAVSLTALGAEQLPRISSSRTMLVMRVRAAIEARLDDPELEAHQVAEAVGISVRYANAVLADRNTSVMRLVRELRLEHCRKALEDPSQSRRTISEIAFSWGFSDMTHFGRIFRKAYGLLPKDYRNQTAGHSASHDLSRM